MQEKLENESCFGHQASGAVKNDRKCSLHYSGPWNSETMIDRLLNRFLFLHFFLNPIYIREHTYLY